MSLLKQTSVEVAGPFIRTCLHMIAGKYENQEKDALTYHITCHTINEIEWFKAVANALGISDH